MINSLIHMTLKNTRIVFTALATRTIWVKTYLFLQHSSFLSALSFTIISLFILPVSLYLRIFLHYVFLRDYGTSIFLQKNSFFTTILRFFKSKHHDLQSYSQLTFRHTIFQHQFHHHYQPPSTNIPESILYLPFPTCHLHRYLFKFDC